MIPRISLADLSAEDLSNEMVRRISAHTPEWKNAQPGDPGRTLIDLFAWMGETILYRANLTPRRMRLEFLNLLNLKQRPAEPARGLLQLVQKVPAKAKPIFVNVGTKANGPVAFEVLNPATVQPFEGICFFKRKMSAQELAGLNEVIASLADVYGISSAIPYATERLFAPGAPPSPQGIDAVGASIDQTLWIGLFACDESAAARNAALSALNEQHCMLNIGFVPKITLPETQDLPTNPSINWSIATKGETESDVAFIDLEVDEDLTRGLTREGTLRLVLPRADLVFAPSNDLESEVDAGVGNRPPRIDDVKLANRLIGWIRLSAKDAAAKLPLTWLGINAVMVDQRETHAAISLGVATGQAGQRFKLPAKDIDGQSLSVSVSEPGGQFEPWRPISDLGIAQRDDAVFEIDAQDGSILFGDGLTGRLLPRGSRIRLDTMRAGGGTVGNVSAGAITKIELSGLVAYQPSRFHSGRDAETLEAAEKRVSAMLTHTNRCVTIEDYRTIAQELDVARVEVLPGFRPYQRRLGCAGVVAVMVLPDQEARVAPLPRADRRLLDQVHAHLDPRRPLGTELYCISPEYQGLGITIGITVREGFAREEVVRAVKQRMYDLLWPLEGGGNSGEGWGLGEPVRNLELQVETARVPGVATVLGLNLFAATAAGLSLLPRLSEQGSGIVMQSLTLTGWQLPELLAIEVYADGRRPADILALNSSGNTGDENRGIGVPVIPQVC